MPQISGVELLTKVRAKHPRAIRMLFTGYADVEAVIAAINQGHVFQFLRKPWQPDDLLAAVKEATVEYDRLVEEIEEKTRLQAEIKSLVDRVTALEREVNRLRGG